MTRWFKSVSDIFILGQILNSICPNAFHSILLFPIPEHKCLNCTTPQIWFIWWLQLLQKKIAQWFEEKKLKDVIHSLAFQVDLKGFKVGQVQWCWFRGKRVDRKDLDLTGVHFGNYSYSWTIANHWRALNCFGIWVWSTLILCRRRLLVVSLIMPASNRCAK